MSNLIELTDWTTKEPCFLDSTTITAIFLLEALNEFPVMGGERKLPAIPPRTKVVCGEEVFLVTQTPRAIYTAIVSAERKREQMATASREHVFGQGPLK